MAGKILSSFEYVPPQDSSEDELPSEYSVLRVLPVPAEVFTFLNKVKLPCFHALSISRAAAEQ